jgi:hypothetical protein
MFLALSDLGNSATVGTTRNLLALKFLCISTELIF